MSAQFSLATTPMLDKSLHKLDPTTQRKIAAYLSELLTLPDPLLKGKALVGNYAGVRRYRIGDYRILTEISEGQLVIVAIQVGHRRRV